MTKDSKLTTTEAIIVEVFDARQSEIARNNMIQKYIPFIVNSIREITGSYVKIGDSDELSIGLMAFNEAIDRYDAERGLFLSYAKLVIASRLKRYFERNNDRDISIAIEDIDLIKSEQLVNKHLEQSTLEEEIEQWKKELIKFNITFHDLLDKKPKHKDTRHKAIEISKSISQNQSIVNLMFEKYRLPIQMIHQNLRISVKVLEGSRVFIISVVIIFVKELGAIKRWILRD